MPRFENYDSLGGCLLDAMEHREITISQLARWTEMEESRIRGLLNGTEKMDWQTAFKFESLLWVPINVLLSLQ